MGLYLAVFAGDEEVDGVEVGSYADYGAFISTVIDRLEAGKAGNQFPTLTLHSDCEGTWTPQECSRLNKDLHQIAEAFKALPPVALSSEWKVDVAKRMGIKLGSLLDCFFDVDGENLVERLAGLCRLVQKYDMPILFQ